MSINDFRKELKWSVIFVVILFGGCFIMDILIHRDYEIFLQYTTLIDMRITTLENRLAVQGATSIDIVNTMVMPACIKGRRHGD